MNGIKNLELRIKSGRGFTLIELLIVIAIISILATLLMVNFVGIRQRARDGQRKSDLRQIQSALELYRSDLGSYPSSSTLANCPAVNPVSFGNNPTCTSLYMQKVPTDPMGSGYYNGGAYYFSSTTTTYTISACIENTNDPQGTSTSPGGTGCSTNFYYVLTNP